MLVSTTYGTVSDIEILWMLLAGVGAVFSAFSLRDALADFSALRERHIPKNGKQLIASYSVRAEGIRLILQLIYLTIGILVAFLPDAPVQNQPTRLVVIGALIRWGLITGSALITIKSIDAYITRRKLLKGPDHVE